MSSASVRAVWPTVTARNSRRSPRPALLFGPALLITDMASSRDARSAGRSPATTAPMRATASPEMRTGQTVVTASSRGIAGPAMTLKIFTIPIARLTPSALPRSASSRLSIETCRNSTSRRTPSAVRTAYSSCLCSPRTSSSAATFPHAINRTNAAAPKSGSRMRRASALKLSVSAWSCGVILSKSGSAWACRDAMTSSSARACSIVAPSRNRPTTSQNGAFIRSGFPAIGIQKSTSALTL